MPQVLTDLEVNEVSLVDRPANSEVVDGKKIPRARIALWKRDGGQEEEVRMNDETWDINDPLCQAVDPVYKAGKTEDGKEFPASDYAYVPDKESPSTWKLRLTSTPGGKPDARIVGAAVAALGKGFRGNKVSIPADALAGVKAKVRAAWKAANPDKSSDELPPVLKGDNMTLEQIEKKVEEQDSVIAALKADNDALALKYETVLKMTKKERKLFGGMSEEKRKEYMAADTEKRKAMMDACEKEAAKGKDDEDGDEDGDMKKKVKKLEEDQAAEIKARDERIAKLESYQVEANKQLEAISKRERLLHFTKRAETELPHTSGRPEEKGAMLMELAEKFGGEDSDVFKRYLDTLKTADAAQAKHFQEVGKSGGAINAGAALEAKAAEIAKRDSISVPKAMEKALRENPELYQEYSQPRLQPRN